MKVSIVTAHDNGVRLSSELVALLCWSVIIRDVVFEMHHIPKGSEKLNLDTAIKMKCLKKSAPHSVALACHVASRIEGDSSRVKKKRIYICRYCA